MKNLIRLTKINLLTVFDFYKVKNAKTSAEKRKEIPKFLVILLAFVYLGWFLFIFAKSTLKGMISMNIGYVVLPMFMAMSSTYILFTSIFKVNKVLFNSKDYSILLSLPIKKGTIISSKVILLYIFNLIYSTLFMLPCYIAYVSLVTTSISFHVIYWLSFFFVPLVPTVIGALIGTLLTGVSSKFKYKNVVSIILSIVFFVVVMGISYATNSVTNADLANMGNTMVGIFNKIYPLTKVYSLMLEGNYLYLLLFLGISLGIFEGFKYFTQSFFDKINSNLSSVTIINKYDDKNNKVHKPVMSLYLKELKRFFSSSLYVMNTGLGSILLTIGTIALVIVGPDKLETLLQFEGMSNAITKFAPLIISILAVMTCTTYPSISLEGKNLWILKTLPVSTKTIFIAKMLVNYTITVPFIIINSIILSLYLKLSFVTFILMLIVPFTFTIFISAFGLFMNLLFPDFNWTTEVKPIKQGVASFISIMTGLILAIIPLSITTSINPNLYSLLIGIVMLLISGVIYYLLFTVGKKKFEVL